MFIWKPYFIGSLDRIFSVLPPQVPPARYNASYRDIWMVYQNIIRIPSVYLRIPLVLKNFFLIKILHKTSFVLSQRIYTHGIRNNISKTWCNYSETLSHPLIKINFPSDLGRFQNHFFYFLETFLKILFSSNTFTTCCCTQLVNIAWQLWILVNSPASITRHSHTFWRSGSRVKGRNKWGEYT